MKKTLRIICFVFVCLFIMQLVGCGNQKSTDVMALTNYMQYMTVPENMPVNAYEKAEFNDAIYYYLDRGPCETGETDNVVLIVVYSKATKSYKNYFWLDMNAGLHTDVKDRWDNRATEANSTHVFTEDEIKTLAKEAADYCNENKKDS